MTPIETRIVLRPTPADLLHLAAITRSLRTAGRPYVTRADVLRHALASIAAPLLASGASQ